MEEAMTLLHMGIKQISQLKSEIGFLANYLNAMYLTRGSPYEHLSFFLMRMHFRSCKPSLT